MTDTPVIAGARAAFAGDPSAPAVMDEAGILTWGEFEGRLEEIAAGLRSPGCGPVGILLPSGTEFLATFLAASVAGRAACTLDPAWADPEIEAAIEDAGVTSLVSGGRVTALPGKAGAGPADSEDPVFYIGFTSGTSGRPKPFARRAASWVTSFGPAADLFRLRSGDLVFLPGALHNSHFLFGAVFALNRGAAIRLYGRYDPLSLAADLSEAERAVVYLVPTMIHDLAQAARRSFESVHSVVVSGAKMEPRHWQAARDLFPGAEVSEIYGASELSFVTVCTGERDGDPGFVGQPFPGVEVEVRPPGRDAGPTDHEGAGLVFARSPYLFDGYLEDSVAVSPVGRDGFMTVGDVGRLGPEGLSLSGRASNMLITGGKNVHPEEVEAALLGQPTVTGSVVIGVPHERWGDELVAFVAFDRDAGSPGSDELRDFLKSRVASYKVPKRWFALETLPRTAAGKLDRSAERLFAGAREL